MVVAVNTRMTCLFAIAMYIQYLSPDTMCWGF